MEKPLHLLAATFRQIAGRHRQRVRLAGGRRSRPIIAAASRTLSAHGSAGVGARGRVSRSRGRTFALQRPHRRRVRDRAQDGQPLRVPQRQGPQGPTARGATFASRAGRLREKTSCECRR